MPREKKPKLTRRKDGRYKCKYHDKQFYGDTPEEAFALRQEYIEAEKAGYSVRATVTEYALPWLKRTFPAVSRSTYAGLATHLQHLIDTIGDLQVAEVVPSDVKQVYSDHYRDLQQLYQISPSTVLLPVRFCGG